GRRADEDGQDPQPERGTASDDHYPGQAGQQPQHHRSPVVRREAGIVRGRWRLGGRRRGAEPTEPVRAPLAQPAQVSHARLPPGAAVRMRRAAFAPRGPGIRGARPGRQAPHARAGGVPAGRRHRQVPAVPPVAHLVLVPGGGGGFTFSPPGHTLFPGGPPGPPPPPHPPPPPPRRGPPPPRAAPPPPLPPPPPPPPTPP